MQQSSFPYSKNRYYNPVSKIQSLIHNLDAELVHLCKQCTVPKPVMNSFNTTSNIIAPRSPLNTNTISRVAAVEGSPDLHKRQLRNIYRTRVIDAYRNRRIFTVYGNYHTVRRALMRRGWLEKLPPGRLPKLQAMSEDSLLEHARRGNDYEAVAISKMINHFPSFFIWQSKQQRDLCADVLPYRNRVRRSNLLDFSTKVGLVGCAEHEMWYREEGVCGMSYPRFYRLGSGNFEERMAFIDDYQQTQCRSLLKYIREEDLSELVDEEKGTVLTTTLDYAIARLKKLIRDWEHGSLDDSNMTQPTAGEVVENQTFLINSREILLKKAKFKTSEKVIKEYGRLASSYLDYIEKLRPDYKWDGCRNLWILKPGYQSRGIGIVIRSSLDDILQWTSSNATRRYIVQKYIERPLLIYRTKFDVRQYMLLTIGESTISIWLYRDCYLRFSSQEFTMDDLRESIHLTNNSVQKRYKNKPTRDPRLPKHNMWTLDQFKIHLKHLNAPENTWNDRIYAGFKQNLIAVVMASMDETEFIPNAFELYGCDFMLDENYRPILIEINSTPDLSPSTEVTARICPMALKDVIRVIVDLPKNPRASTGLFELVYEINYSFSRSKESQNALELSGKAMTLNDPATQKFNNRTKFIRKFIKTVNKTTTCIKTKTTPKPKPTTLPKIHSKTRDAIGTVTSNAMAEGTTNRINDAPSKHVLNPTTREALALHYTNPK